MEYICNENRSWSTAGSFHSEDTIFATYYDAGVCVFGIRDAFAPKEIASWSPPPPKKLIDPRPNVALAAKAADIYVASDGLMYISDWNAGLNVLQYQGEIRTSLRLNAPPTKVHASWFARFSAAIVLYSKRKNKPIRTRF